MYRIQELIRNRKHGILTIPGFVRQEFLQETVRKNDFSLRIICIIIFAVECYNLVRVVFWSKSGLRTWNNRIYFLMYCALILIAALWIVLRRTLRQASLRRRWAAQFAVSYLIFLWHLGLNAYDLYRDPDAGITVLTTALLGLAMFVQMPPLYGLLQFAGGYLLFRIVMLPLLDAGSRVNMTITFVVSLMVSLTQAHHLSVALEQQKQILQMNAKLQELAQTDLLTGLLNKTTVECRAEQMLYRLGTDGKFGGLTMFLFDLDGFKSVNDQYGHPCGDHVLTETADCMRAAFPLAAGLGRVGGDEFAVLYDRPLTEAQAIVLGKGLQERIVKIRWQEKQLEIGCSMGICICTQVQCTYEQLYAETDRMLYRAKKTGKGRCCVQKLDRMTKNGAGWKKSDRMTQEQQDVFLSDGMVETACWEPCGDRKKRVGD